ncbi:glycoside hydrolase family 1 protein [Nocardioides sp.]|uniref:glycoside hydrolase family 1 protein n=1 Tax=Nocardioides sp. TaxID=35761 RepID=UPI003518C69E
MSRRSSGQVTGYVPQLPPGFVLGVASSALQTEGAAGGRAETVWDPFVRRTGGDSPAVAADHYHHVRGDLALLKRLGVTGYRFSTSWARVQPDGPDTVDQAGLDFYDRLVDGLLEAGIAPMVTLHHWDLPQRLEDDGGWLNRATIEEFADYAYVMADRLGDRVASWVPVNAPNVETMQGYATGQHAPGRRLGLDSLHVAHHLLLAHGRATVALRQAGVVAVGCANFHAPMWPASDDPADVGATKLFDALWNGMFLEPMLLGQYPADLMPLVEELIQPGDLAEIRQPLDFYGVSYYRPMRVAAAEEGAPLPFRFLQTVGYPETDAGWAVVPDALREWLITLRARFRNALPPIVITECGASYDTGPGPGGVIDDAARVDYLAGHLEAVSAAAQRGVDVRGFYVWSFLDSFQWTGGFRERYGLVHVDFDSLVRTPKRSYHWYSRVIAAQPRSRG